MLAHKPILWSKFWGDRKLFGGMGGAGAGGELVVRNSAFLRIGLFGGAFGLDLENRAVGELVLLKWTLEIFYAEFSFKWTVTYATPTLPELLNGLANVIMGKLPQLNTKSSFQLTAVKDIKTVLVLLCELEPALDAWVAAMPAIDVIIRELRSFLEAASQMLLSLLHVATPTERLTDTRRALQELHRLIGDYAALTSALPVLSAEPPRAVGGRRTAVVPDTPSLFTPANDTSTPPPSAPVATPWVLVEQSHEVREEAIALLRSVVGPGGLNALGISPEASGTAGGNGAVGPNGTAGASGTAGGNGTESSPADLSVLEGMQSLKTLIEGFQTSLSTIGHSPSKLGAALASGSGARVATAISAAGEGDTMRMSTYAFACLYMHAYTHSMHSIYSPYELKTLLRFARSPKLYCKYVARHRGRGTGRRRRGRRHNAGTASQGIELPGGYGRLWICGARDDGLSRPGAQSCCLPAAVADGAGLKRRCVGVHHRPAVRAARWHWC